MIIVQYYIIYYHTTRPARGVHFIDIYVLGHQHLYQSTLQGSEWYRIPLRNSTHIPIQSNPK